MLNFHELFGGATGSDLIEFERFSKLANKYYAPTDAGRLFKVPVDMADDFSRLLNRFKRKGVKIKRRAGGPRYDACRMTTLVKDAKYFMYYLQQAYVPHVEPLRVDPKVSNRELMEICGLYQDDEPLAVILKLESIISTYQINKSDADWLRSLTKGE